MDIRRERVSWDATDPDSMARAYQQIQDMLTRKRMTADGRLNAEKMKYEIQRALGKRGFQIVGGISGYRAIKLPSTKGV